MGVSVDPHYYGKIILPQTAIENDGGIHEADTLFHLMDNTSLGFKRRLPEMRLHSINTLLSGMRSFSTSACNKIAATRGIMRMYNCKDPIGISWPDEMPHSQRAVRLQFMRYVPSYKPTVLWSTSYGLAINRRLVQPATSQSWKHLVDVQNQLSLTFPPNASSEWNPTNPKSTHSS